MFHTIKEAASLMSCSTRTIKRMVNAGLLKCTSVGVGNRRSIRVQLPEPETKDQTKNRRRKEYVGEILKRR